MFSVGGETSEGGLGFDSRAVDDVSVLRGDSVDRGNLLLGFVRNEISRPTTGLFRPSQLDCAVSSIADALEMRSRSHPASFIANMCRTSMIHALHFTS